MADDEATQHETSDPDGCPEPDECPVHQAMRSRVRAVEHDGEKYVNLLDIAAWIKNQGQLELLRLYRQAEGADTPEGTEAVIEAAILNVQTGMQIAHHSVVCLDGEVLRGIDDPEAILIRPEDLRLDSDTIPADWVAPSNETKGGDHLD